MPALAFTDPSLLSALVVLPAVWWLLRALPPAPRPLAFPPIELLRAVVGQEETPARTPPWLLILRLVIGALVIFGFAGPLLDPEPVLPGRDPVLLVVDNGWAAAAHWALRLSTLEQVLAVVERQQRPVALLATAPEPGGAPPLLIAPTRAADLRARLPALMPRPWPVDRRAAAARLADDALPAHVTSVWLSDGLASSGGGGGGGGGGPSASGGEHRPASGGEYLAEMLAARGPTEIRLEAVGERALMLRPPVLRGGRLSAEVLRASGKTGGGTGGNAGGTGAAGTTVRGVRLNAGDGRGLGRAEASFADGAGAAEVTFSLPLELFNQAATLSIEGEGSAGAVALLDDRWRRRVAGLVVEADRHADQPLLDARHYLVQALGPAAELRSGPLAAVLDQAPSLLVLIDPGPLATPDVARVRDWMNNGGVVLRFAGPRLAARSGGAGEGGGRDPAGDPLLPVRLRPGDRTLGGALAWTEPLHPAPFERTSPFLGLPVPAEVSVSRQVLAEPDAALDRRTWARLTDGTPLVTAEAVGRGWLVLVHTTADPTWSDLVLSGLFVDMVQRLLVLGNAATATPGGGRGASGAAGDTDGRGARVLAPIQTLDGFGRLGEPPAGVRSIAVDAFAGQSVDAEHPPGVYGGGGERRALSLGSGLSAPTALRLPATAAVRSYGAGRERPLGPAALALALALATLDLVLSLVMRGLIAGRHRHRTPAGRHLA